MRPLFQIKFLTGSLLAAACSLLIGCWNASEGPKVKDQELTDFWQEFRAAALSEDAARLEKLTAFPFEIRGTLDTTPARTFDRPGFRRLAPKLLSQDSGMTEKGESMKELLKRSVNAPPDEAGTSRLGNFEFRKTLQGWRFARAYLED